jgi:hypothetical protein
MNTFTQAAYKFLWFGICIFAIAAMLYTIFKPMPTENMPSKIEIVDSYENCKIIRWTDPSQRWRYFLHCP